MTTRFFRRVAPVWLALCILASTLLPAVASAAGGGRRVAPEERVDGDVSTITESIDVDGEVSGDVTSWSGDITVRGRVGGDVVSYTGHVTVEPGANVGGSVLSLGGGVERHQNAYVAHAALGGTSGNLAMAGIMGIVVPQAETTAPANPPIARALFGVMIGLFVAAFALLWSAFWPNRTLAAAWTLQQRPMFSAIAGVLATIVVLLLGPPLIGLLAASMIGLPILVLLAVLVNAPFVFGLAVVGRAIPLWLGAKIQPTSHPSTATLVGLGLIAVVLAVVCANAPITGFLFFYLLASPGLGATFLSRGGLLPLVRAR